MDLFREFTTSPAWFLVGYATARLIQHFDHSHWGDHDHS